MATGVGITDQLSAVKGVSLGTTCAGIKVENRRDLVIFELAQGTSVGAVFTKNAFCAAPVTLCKTHLAQTNNIRYLVVNTGNANAGTGKQGMQDALQTCEQIADLAGVEAHQVLPFSTGVIGEYLPMDTILKALPNALSDTAEDHWLEAAEGILTTDTRAKAASQVIEFNGETITVTGIAKGSGMIRPNMATMLAFVATDAAVPAQLLQQMTREATDQSFNRITVDSDTSTNDACVLVATGQAQAAAISSDQDERYAALLKAVKQVMLSLAQQIIRDGEGANKFIEVAVEGALNTEEALKVAYSVADSPLFKTAMSASDANWGRILMAVGKSGVEALDVDKIDVYLGDAQIVAQGERAAQYTEEQGAAAVAGEDIRVRICLNRGEVSDTVWTSDLSYEYVRINAEYRS
ncbi:bifunctional glutamate N-acetyltransferase/amino-acid acetyltransferase ArgJ [Reinekea thalattae]|uniref:Arginine biosynthesis bifunctional protein ArgJ n=1 Tax=Reinekea thalattae TaxID=2593301 RepID=A0A5C8Z1P2_9GAMM|nr:bifunctional glutamate N-acetyltransferase/amino-acid acetyltransferase ArgJ [Reinekea thalattae]TXR52005.1 bifunctional glutamate N-acetyltransferase/amino-acid acetyltransferase ArgJ [Reinekea thalattae]